MPTESDARALMVENMANNPEFEAGIWYPAEDEYRFVYIDPTALPTRQGDPLAVFQMVHEEPEGRQVPLLVAFVRPQDLDLASAPKAWGRGKRFPAPALPSAR